MIKRTYEGEGNGRKVKRREFQCETCGKATEIVGKKLVLARLKLPEEPCTERIVVWCGNCIEKTGVEKCFSPS